MSHFKAKMHQIRFLVSVRFPLLTLCLRWSLALKTHAHKHTHRESVPMRNVFFQLAYNSKALR